MLRKFFPRDKNYVLEQAQLSLEQPLLHYLVDFVKVEYLMKHNPLGIQDEMADKIQQHHSHDYRHLHEFYVTLAGIFRFTYYGDNQLEFIFTGLDDSEKYRKEWTAGFKAWAKEFCQYHNFLRAVLDLTVFYPADSPVLLMDTRMKVFIAQFFELKIHPQKGIVSQKRSVA